MDSLPNNFQSARRAFWISAGLHVALFVTVICTALFTPPPPPPPHALLVRTVSLKAGPAIRIAATPKGQTTTKGQAAAKGQGGTPKQVEAPKTPPKPAEELVAEKETGVPAEDSPGPPAPQAKEPEEPISEEPPAPTQKATIPTSSAKAPSKTTTASKATTSAKQSTTSKTTTTAKKGPTKTQSSASKTAQGKGTTPSKGSSSAQKTSGAKSTGTKSSAPQYDQNLLSDALRRLDRSKSAAAKGGGGSGSGSGNGSGSGSGGVARVGTVGALNVESGLVTGVGEGEGDEAYEGYATASPEACYIGDLIRRLQLNVRLPEPGEIRVKLSLKKNGTVSSIQVLTGKTSIKQAIEKKLRAVHFSPFGTSFSGEPEHTFNLRLSNDLVWSCR